MDSSIIALKLKELRKSMNKSKEEVANDLGITLRSLEAYEQGQRIPRDSIKLLIAKYYNTTVEYIFFEKQLHEM